MITPYMQRILIGIMMFCTSLLYTQTDQERFLHANVLYEKQEWAHALELYQNIECKGSSVWYNMGNCYYYLKDYPHAHAAWRKAERGLSGQWRRRCSEQQALIGISQHTIAGKNIWQRMRSYCTEWAAGCSLLQLQLLVLLAWYLALLFSRLPIRSKLYGLLRFVPTGVSVVCSIVLLVAWHDRSQVIAIVCSEKVALFAGPDNRYETIGNVHAHEELTVCDMRPGWCRVSTAAGSGWIDAQEIETVG